MARSEQLGVSLSLSDVHTISERSGLYSTTWLQPSCVKMLPLGRRKRSWHCPMGCDH
eukprot:COSAG06_NODE_53379_length_300_cov_1.019900_1_plen_56_part_10